MTAPAPRSARDGPDRPEGPPSGRPEVTAAAEGPKPGAEATVPTFVLCTASPRRVALLEAAGVAFERGAAPDVDETPPRGLAAAEVAEALAREKARAAARRYPRRVVLCADTTVVLDGALLEKPTDVADARRMLRLLSGREHQVVTGVAAARDGLLASGQEAARVRFKALSEAEIDAYVAGGEPMGKAGAYAIQGGAAGFVAWRGGDVDTVVGLPVRRALALVRQVAEGADGRSR